MSATISIQEVLSAMENLDGSIEYSIEFVRAHDGRNGPKGSIRRVARCRKGAKAPNDPSKKKASGMTKKKALHKTSGTLPMVDIDRDQYITPRITHIIKFNDFKVIH